MRRVWLTAAAVAVIVAGLVFGRGLLIRSGPREQKPFTFEYALDKSNAPFFVRGDTYATLAASSPFYAGAQPLPSQRTSEFDQMRARKVREILDEADALVKATARLDPRVAGLRDAFTAQLSELVRRDKAFDKFARECMREMLTAQTREAIGTCAYAAIKTDSADPFASSFMEYLKVLKAEELGLAYLRDVDGIAKLAAVMVLTCQKSPSAKIKEIGSKLDGEMAVLDSTQRDLRRVAASLDRIRWGKRQLKTGDYYFGRAAVAFITDSLPDLKKRLKTVKPRGEITAKDLAFISAYLSFVGKMNAELGKQLDKADRRDLVPVKEADAGSPECAWADAGNPNYTKAYQSVAAPASPPQAGGWVDAGWEEAKSAASATWNAAKWAGRKGQRAVQFTADTAGTYVRIYSRMAYGIARGESFDDWGGDISRDTQEIVDNYEGRLPQQSVLRTADEYLGEAESAAERAAGGAVGSVAGEGWTSWLGGKIARGTVGLFTGLGRGIFRISDPRSSNADLATGALDIGFAVIGGSKVIIKASQAPGLARGLAQEGSMVGDQALNYLARWWNARRIASLSGEVSQILKSGAEDNAGRAVSNMMEILARQQTQKLLEEAMKGVAQQIRNTFLQGVKEGVSASRTTLAQNWRQFVDTYLKRNVGSYRQQLLAVLGANKGEYLDNLVGQWLDDWIKDTVEQSLLEAPSNDAIAGTWNMTIKILKVGAPPAPTTKKKEGCDNLGPQIVRSLIGRKMPMTLRISPGAPPTTGTAKMVGAKGKPASLPYTYQDGQIVMQTSSQGASIVFTGEAKKQGDETLRMDGTFKIKKGSGYMSGNWWATK